MGQEQADDLVELASQALLGGPRHLTPQEACDHAGVPRATADALWRAMGFPDAPDGETAFTEADVEALRVADRLARDGMVDEEAVRHQTRVMSQALATIAAAQIEITEERDRKPERLGAYALEVLPALDDVLRYLYHRHLLAAVERALLLDDTERPRDALSVGFADLVGFTRTANQVDESELAGLVERFAASAADVVAEGGGRVVKMLGDEVMFSTTEPADAVGIALRLVAEVGDHDGVAPLRAGVACGPVLLRHGDLFGRTVNLAHRLVEAARPGTLVVDEQVAAALEGDERYEARRILSIRRLQGFERLRVWAVRPHEPGTG